MQQHRQNSGAVCVFAAHRRRETPRRGTPGRRESKPVRIQYTPAAEHLWLQLHTVLCKCLQLFYYLLLFKEPIVNCIVRHFVTRNLSQKHSNVFSWTQIKQLDSIPAPMRWFLKSNKLKCGRCVLKKIREIWTSGGLVGDPPTTSAHQGKLVFPSWLLSCCWRFLAIARWKKPVAPKTSVWLLWLVHTANTQFPLVTGGYWGGH